MIYKPKFKTVEAAILTLAGCELAVIVDGEATHVVQAAAFRVLFEPVGEPPAVASNSASPASPKDPPRNLSVAPACRVPEVQLPPFASHLKPSLTPVVKSTRPAPAQERILKLMHEMGPGAFSTKEISARAYPDHDTQAALSSTWQLIRSLEARGLVEKKEVQVYEGGRPVRVAEKWAVVDVQEQANG